MANKEYRWYVYQLVDPRTGEPFYVGKGTGKRIAAHEQEARRGVCSKKTKRINDLWCAGVSIERQLLAHFNDEQAAYDHETDVIASIGLYRLTNVLPGGQSAWDRRFAARGVTPKVSIDRWGSVIEHIASIMRASDGLKKEYKARFVGAGELINLMSEAVEKVFGGPVGYAKHTLRHLIAAYGAQAVAGEFQRFNVDLRVA